MKTGLERIVERIRAPLRLKISEWAEKEARVLKPGGAVDRFNLEHFPWERDMLDDPLNPKASEIVWVMASQTGGKTICIILIVEFFIVQRPTGIQVVYPTLDSAKKWMRKKFIRLTRVTPCMKGLLKEPRERSSESTTLDRMFPGGDLTAIGAESTTAFRQESKEVVIEDELDNYKMTEEGDPEELAARATITFSEGFTLKASSPTLSGFSRIWNRFEGNEELGIVSTDKQYYHVPCPACGLMQHLKWAQFKFSFTAEEYEKALKLMPSWPRGVQSPKSKVQGQTGPQSGDTIRDTKRTVYVCENAGCGCWWTDDMRQRAIRSGHPAHPEVHGQRAGWVATAAFNGVIGRHLNGFYRLVGRKRGFVNLHHEFAEGFLKSAAGGRDKLMAWTNMTQAMPFSEKFGQVEWHPLMKRAEEFSVYLREGKPELELPEEVMMLGFGADVHPDRVEIGVVGFGDQEETWWIDKSVVWGNFDLPEMQERVNLALLRKWHHPVLGDMGLTCGGMDCGHQTKIKAVYRFCRAHRARNVWAVKGSPVPNAPVYTAAQEKRFGIWRLNLGTDTLKTTIFDRLAVDEPGARYIHFPALRIKYTARVDARPTGSEKEFVTAFGEKFYRQLCSEKLERKLDRGVFRQRWIQTQDRNEVLDMFVYVLGAFERLNATGWIARQWEMICKKAEIGKQKSEIKKEPDKESGTVDYILKGPVAVTIKKALPAVAAGSKRERWRQKHGGEQRPPGERGFRW
jgi:phage terminase large subunit GpA-like protein